MSGLGAEEWQVVWLSLKIAGVATLFSLPLAILTAFALARGRFRGKALLNAIVHLPLVLPPVVTGYALLLLFAPNAPLGAFLQDQFGLTLAFRWTGAALAAGIMAFPLMVRAIRLSLEAIDPGLEVAAETLGAGRGAVFATITLPLMLPGILAGLVLAFAKALGEFGATITFVSNIPGETRTLPIAIYSYLQVPGQEAAALELAYVAVAISLAAILLSEWISARVARRLGGQDAER
ncbi:Molybdenum transport system permease protein ModB [Pseudoruegeria aquimaris]|uniref:Molybdenum transport system permease n=1 Tax=Pseudoruegeria aquimaris TaxID=393663 RepID=A0A1Y5TEH7_9RHOB|nr:molybdate ABC transporter permease subunit [Pseudoruegeria aquimaris]SLN61912.1 Molybdenum transport system permease protein ModB [Pseudoruegeria aquimaris]